jgi:hypothetical protein
MQPNPKRTPKPDRRRTLELIAASPNGVTESLLIAHGVTIAQMVELVRAGHASAHAERVVAGSHTMEVATVRITDAGRKLLARDGTGR